MNVNFGSSYNLYQKWGKVDRNLQKTETEPKKDPPPDKTAPEGKGTISGAPGYNPNKAR